MLWECICTNACVEECAPYVCSRQRNSNNSSAIWKAMIIMQTGTRFERVRERRPRKGGKQASKQAEGTEAITATLRVREHNHTEMDAGAR